MVKNKDEVRRLTPNPQNTDTQSKLQRNIYYSSLQFGTNLQNYAFFDTVYQFVNTINKTRRYLLIKG